MNIHQSTDLLPEPLPSARELQLVAQVEKLQAELAQMNDEREKMLLETEQILNSVNELDSQNEALRQGMKQLQSEMAQPQKQMETQATSFQKYPRGRWEMLNRKPIRYGHMEYTPFLNYRHNGEPIGLGIDLLTKVFRSDDLEIEFEPDSKNREWANIFDGLTGSQQKGGAGQCDMIATPLFATFERSTSVAFTAPMFFSNVGLYVSSDMAKKPGWEKLTQGTLREKIYQERELRLLAIPGEISAKLAQKYAPEDRITWLESRSSAYTVFKEMDKGAYGKCAIFSESFAARLQPCVRRERDPVCNVLKWHQFLYPVCFALRLGDHELKNFLNIRMLHLTRSNKVYEMLSEALSKIEDCKMDDKEIKKHFVTEWPCPIDM